MSLVVRRNEGETWRECVARIASKEGLAAECLVEFDHYTTSGDDEAEAAFCALYEWDCCAFEPDPLSEAKPTPPQESPAPTTDAGPEVPGA